jgi:hypothetical protein
MHAVYAGLLAWAMAPAARLALLLQRSCASALPRWSNARWVSPSLQAAQPPYDADAGGIDQKLA